MMYAVRQANRSPTSDAATTPSTPTAATIVVPYPRCSRDINSDTRVTPAPSSPVSPKPAMQRPQSGHHLRDCGRRDQASRPPVSQMGTSSSSDC
jgi:hypothetical protein